VHATRTAARSGPPGYTLIELLVVMFVLGILASIVALNMKPHRDAALATDASRLAALFSLAADEAQIRSRTIAWQADSDGYRFLIASDRGWVALDDNAFRARSWTQAPVAATLSRGHFSPSQGEKIEIPFEKNGVQPPFTLELSAGDVELALAADGIGHYNVVRPEP
jgi:general secretion pathway protein H